MIADEISVSWAIIIAVLIVIAVWLIGKFRFRRVIRYKMKEMEEKGKAETATVPPAVVAARPRRRRAARTKRKATRGGRRARRSATRRRRRRARR